MWRIGLTRFFSPMIIRTTLFCVNYLSHRSYCLSVLEQIERPMKVEIALDPSQVVSLASRVAPAPARAAAAGPRRGRGGRPRAARPAKKTAEELDADMAVSSLLSHLCGLVLIAGLQGYDCGLRMIVYTSRRLMGQYEKFCWRCDLICMFTFVYSGEEVVACVHAVLKDIGFEPICSRA
jgi:hypothetical protein